MELDYELNFTSICRGCKRTESGMTSIFDGNAHQTYPPVDEMLRSIASLNVQENDGLPSLVCTACLSNIQDAFTFILQLIHIDEELSQILAKRKQQYISISTDFVKKENEDEICSVKEEDLYDPILNLYQLEFVPEVVEIEEANKLQSQLEHSSIPKFACEVCNKTFKTARNLENHKSKKHCIKLESTTPTTEISINREVIQFNDQTFQKDSKIPVNNTLTRFDDDSNESAKLNQNLDAADNLYDFDESAPELYAIRRRTTSHLTENAKVFKCKLCAYTSVHEYIIKRHLQTHCKDKPFACSKCNRAFGLRASLLRHSQICNGVDKIACDICNRPNFLSEKQLQIHKLKRHKGKPSKQLLTYQDLRDPWKIIKYYTVPGKDMQQNEDGDNVHLKVQTKDRGGEEEEETFKKITIKLFTCKLCTYTTRHNNCLKKHLLTHSNDNLFACSKCNSTFTFRANMVRHWRNCNGDVHRKARHRGEASKQLIALTAEDLEHPENMKKYFTVSKIDVQVNHDDLKVRSTDDREEGEDREVKSRKKPRKTCKAAKPTKSANLDCSSDLFKCKVCKYTSARMYNLKTHLQRHCKDKPFACTKCNQTFAQKYRMLRHLQSCNGHLNKYTRNKEDASNQVISLSLKDLENPLKIEVLHCN